jgi:hypothetical protein
MEQNKDLIKNSLTIEQVNQFLEDLDAEPEIQNDIIIARTICHGGSSRKLYYYSNTRLFHCFTDCGDSFDIFELVQRIKTREGNAHWELPQSVNYIMRYFGIETEEDGFDSLTSLDEWKILNKIKDDLDKDSIERKAELKFYEESILNNLPKVIFEPWLKEGITKEAIENANIRFNPKTMGIVIPHYDINGDLLGIRERTTIVENERLGKYRPALLNKILYRHPLSFNLYNLNKSKDNIKEYGMAVVLEGKR